MITDKFINNSTMGFNRMILRSIIWNYCIKKKKGEDLEQPLDNFISLFNKISRKSLDKQTKKNLLRYLVDYAFNELLDSAKYIDVKRD